ncbi:unnamed protein product [Mytilus edulis]|uniref:B box-type domain-containing protein n=1 Tax=Mytilus edulis TaxID=6550 RepID=A0A8S3RIR5_MYTED|nr:unnamed protein product [Mytilus edulis]
MAEAHIDNGHTQEQNENGEDATLLSPIAIWIFQLIDLFKTLPHDIRLKDEIKENIQSTLDNLLKARSDKEFYSDFCFHEKPAESYCRDCKNFLDAPCVQYHKEIKKLIPHSVFNFIGHQIDDKHVLNFAPKSSCRMPGHTQNEIVLYCQDCAVLLCKIGRQQHNGHILKILNKGKEIEQMLTKIVQSCGENPQCQLKEIRDLINSIIVPCEENNFTKSADMEKRSLPDDVQHSIDAFRDLHPRNSS